MRFLDMEGGPPSSPSRTKSPIAITRRWPAISHDVHQATIETAVDYHRVRIDADYEKVLLDFLIGRTRSGGVR